MTALEQAQQMADEAGELRYTVEIYSHLFGASADVTAHHPGALPIEAAVLWRPTQGWAEAAVRRWIRKQQKRPSRTFEAA